MKEGKREGRGRKERDGTHIMRAMQSKHTLVQEVGLLAVLPVACGPATLNSLAPELLHNLLPPHKPVQL